MSNATDVLAVGGPGNGRVWCVNRNAERPVRTVTAIAQGVGEITYTINKWWDIGTQRWYWIATNDAYPVGDTEIAWQIVINNFNPAWDLRGHPAPTTEEGDDE